MTMYEEPPIVELDEILDEQGEAESRATRPQVLLVAIGAVVATAGVLTFLVVASPSWIELVRIVAALAQNGATP